MVLRMMIASALVVCHPLVVSGFASSSRHFRILREDCFSSTSDDPCPRFAHVACRIPIVRLSESPSNSDKEALARANNEQRTDVRNLLTQRSIQSFMFLCSECRDPHSGKWIEDFLETKNQLEYHGTGAGYMMRFGGQWDAPLLKMMEQPKDVVVVSAKRRGRGHGGWSKDNPYLEERFVEFEIDVDPVSLTSRILSVREQIAGEWVSDLDVLAQANSQILESYFDRIKDAREKQQEADHHQSAELLDQVPDTAFERTAANILNNRTGFTATASSPFRKGSFDLLYSLCTQASIHRFLRELAAGGSKTEIAFAWLRDYYISRVEDYFDGDQRYGRADDFMEELLLTSPRVIYTDDGKVGMADPLGLAEQIIKIRSRVAAEWKETMQRVPEDHMELRKLLLEKQSQAWSSGSSEEGFE